MILCIDQFFVIFLFKLFYLFSVFSLPFYTLTSLGKNVVEFSCHFYDLPVVATSTSQNQGKTTAIKL